jgi:hypothetical protein
MAARFAVVTEEEIAKIKEDSIPKKPKQATKYGLKIFQCKILNFTCFYLEKNWLSRNATQSLACKQTLGEIPSAVKHQNWDSAPLA